MAEKIVIEAEVKSNIGDVSKDAKSAAGEFKVMGVSLNGVKAGFASAAVTAKGFFGSIKAGLISTGIGAFVVLIGSLVSYFTNTKRGAETLERAMAGLGAIVSVLIDAFSSLGEIIINTFTDPMPALKNFGNGLIKFLKDPTGATRDMFVKATLSVSDFTDELVEETKAMMDLKKLMQELRDEEREFSKVRAQTRQDIQKARLDALDESKTAEERLKALQRANDLELGTTAKSLEMQRRRIEVQKEVMALSENMAEDLDELAALEVGLIDLQTQSFQTQKRLATEMETLTNEIAADKKAIDDKLWSDKIKANDEWNKEQQKSRDSELAADKKLASDKIALDKSVKDAKVGIAKNGLNLISAIAGEGSKIGKAAAVASATVSGVEGVQNAFTTASKSPITTVMPAYPFIQAGLAGAFSAIQIQKILSGSPAGGGGGGGGGASAVPSTPAPQMMSGAFDISGGVAPEAAKAYVVTDEMSNSQNQLANIRRRATI